MGNRKDGLSVDGLGNEDKTPAVIASLIIGFVGIIFLSFIAHWYEVGIRGGGISSSVIVNSLPPIVLFMMIILVVVINPLLRLISNRLVMGAREMFIILVLWLVTSVVCFTNFITPMLITIGNVNSPAVERAAMSRVGFRDYINHSLFLSPHAANEYHLGKSPDGVTRIPPFAGSVLLRERDSRDIGGFAIRLVEGDDSLSRYLRDRFGAESMRAFRQLAAVTRELEDVLLEELNEIIAGPMIYDEATFANVTLTRRIQNLIEMEPDGEQLVRLNRLLLETVYSGMIDRAPEVGSALLRDGDIRDLRGLASNIYQDRDAVSREIRQKFSDEGLNALARYFEAGDQAVPLQVAELNVIMRGPLLLAETELAGVNLSGSARMLANRILLEESYPEKIGRSPAPVAWPFVEADIDDLVGLAAEIAAGANDVSSFLRGMLSEETFELAEGASAGLSGAERDKLSERLVEDLNNVLRGSLIYDAEIFANVELPESSRMLLNRTILEEGYREVVRYASAIPWRLWIGPFAFWLPFMGILMVFSMSLVRMMHRQWSKHELLTYPIAEVMDSFLKREKGYLLPDYFRTRVFWVGFVGVFLMFVINGLNRFFPLMIRIPTVYAHMDLLREFDFIARYTGREGYALFRGMIYPYIIGLAVLLPTDLSLSAWFGFVAMIFGTGFYFLFTGDTITDPDAANIRIGMHVALGVIIILIGRREYFNLLKRAFTFQKSDDKTLNSATTACRIFLLSFAALVVMFVIAGLDWFIAFILVMSIGLIFLLMARLTAESGIPWLVNFRGAATGLPLHLFGASVLGPQALAVIAAVGMPVDADPTNSFAAQETTYQKERERHGWGLGTARFNLILAGGILVAVTASIFFQLWDNYSFGARREKLHPPVAQHLETAATEINRLQIEGQLDRVIEGSGLARLSHFQFDSRFWRFFAIGAIAVAAVMIMRLRFSWWPFHPLPLLFISTWAMSRLYVSFFLGWAIKAAILRIWGGKTFTNLKPFFIGVIMGQAAIVSVWVLIGGIYWIITDTPPPYLPGWI